MSGPEVAQDLVGLGGDGGEGRRVHLAGTGHGALDHVLGHVVSFGREPAVWLWCHGTEDGRPAVMRHSPHRLRPARAAGG